MTAQTFHFRRFPAEQAKRLRSEPRLGFRTVVPFAAGLLFVISAGALWPVSEARGVATGLLVVGLASALAGMVASVVWLLRVLVGGAGHPWGRLLMLALLVSWAGSWITIHVQEFAWANTLNMLQWALAVALLFRLAWLATRPPPEAVVARWDAGANGENLVTNALAQLGPDYVVIHNLPLPGRGDADHVVVGPAGVTVLETKYLAGRITCLGTSGWTQEKPDGVREIADPAMQVERVTAAISGRLASCGLAEVPTYSLLVFAHPRAELDVGLSSVAVARPLELVPLLERLGTERRMLDSRLVAATANALMIAKRPARQKHRRWTAPARAQALVEVACALSVVLMLTFGLLGVARVSGALLGLTAVAREAARAGARAPDAATAFDWAIARGTQAATEYGLAGVLLYVDTSDFERQPSPGPLVPGEVRVRADVTVDLSDVPLVSWAQVQVPLRRAFAEVVDPYRSAPAVTGGDQ